MALEIVRWNDREVQRELCEHLGRGMRKAMLYAEGEVKKALSTGQPVRSTRSGRLVGLAPSRPGQPPHVLTGRLRQSITHEVDVNRTTCRVVGAVGTNVDYARHLEFGTSRMAERPYLRPTVLNAKRQMVRLIFGG